MKKSSLLGIAVVCVALALGGCTKQQKYTAGGAALGATVGGLAGGSWTGAAIGGVVGGIAGAAVSEND